MRSCVLCCTCSVVCTAMCMDGCVHMYTVGGCELCVCSVELDQRNRKRRALFCLTRYQSPSGTLAWLWDVLTCMPQCIHTVLCLALSVAFRLVREASQVSFHVKETPKIRMPHIVMEKVTQPSHPSCQRRLLLQQQWHVRYHCGCLCLDYSPWPRHSHNRFVWPTASCLFSILSLDAHHRCISLASSSPL